MRVRLRDADRVVTGTHDTRLARVAVRTCRTDGMLYERIADGADGVPEYRATELRRPDPTDAVVVIDCAGNVWATVHVPQGTIPDAVTAHGVRCPLWTRRDQAGMAVYRRPEKAA